MKLEATDSTPLPTPEDPDTLAPASPAGEEPEVSDAAGTSPANSALGRDSEKNEAGRQLKPESEPVSPSPDFRVAKTFV